MNSTHIDTIAFPKSPLGDLGIKIGIFGVRHLSPSASYHLLRYLNERKPQCVLIEGPSDAGEILKNLTDKRIKPPVALLAYTNELPIETILYPFAEYSPELQAIQWAARNKAEVRFIDLPSDIILKLRQERNAENSTEEKQAFYHFHNGIYDKLAAYTGESDYESYWERNFEHNLQEGSLREGLSLQSQQIRSLVVDEEYQAAPSDFAYNLIREAHMRREIQRTISEGKKPEDIVVVAGAYHVSGILAGLPPLSDEELKMLPRVETMMTLMPYSYLRLSSRTGYGAGNLAPFYFERMWQCMKNGNLEQLPAIYLSSVADALRQAGNNASSASVIEAVRLANSLTAMHDGSLPVLKDLHDAAVTCLGHGELSQVAEALNRVDIGTAIGGLPEGVSQTPVQEDMTRELKRLKLTNYKSAVSQEITLDLRGNRSVKSEEAAFLDLNRSTFFHRIKLLNIQFAKPLPVNQSGATWAEKWVLQWSPEVEIEVVESNLKGETVEIAAAFVLKESLDDCTDIQNAAKLIKTACECNLTESFANALAVLQKLAVDSGSFREAAGAARELSVLIQYGDIRRFDLQPLVPLLQQLFLRASLLLVDASSCDDKAATELTSAINAMDLISQEQYEVVDSTLWITELKKLAWRDDRNAKLSGLAFSILLEHNLADEEA